MTFQTLKRDIDGQWIESPVRRFIFPAGEQTIKYENSHQLKGEHVAVVRSADANDLVALRMWSHTIHQSGGHPSAVIPYLPGARDDKRARRGAEIYAELINDCELDEVICLDPHSEVMPGLINNCRVLYGIPLIESAIKANGLDVRGVIIPDEGAVNRSTHLAQRLGVPAYQALKHRDPLTGKLSGFTCEPLPPEGLMLVSDDICDGGGTFMGIAEATVLTQERLALWVTHGVFSGNAPQLHDAYSLIMTTDSMDPQSPVVRQVQPCIPYLLDHTNKDIE